MSDILFAMLLTSLFSSFAGATADKTSGLCESSATTLFSCSVKGGKFLSVCEITKHSDVSKIEYRFGKLKHVELKLPETKQDSVSYNTVMYSGGGGAYARFKHAEQAYIVFSKILKGEGDSAGVIVQKYDKVLTKILCQKGGDLDAPALEKLGIAKEADDVDPL